MRYCGTCITPENRPGIRFDADGACNCAKKSDKDAIDWAARERQLSDVVAHAKARSRGYDCVIPVSGGKDSTWQVVKCLELGLTPLAVTWRPPGRTALGQANLDNLIRLGVDHVDYSISPAVEKKFTWLAFERHGTTALPMHLALFAIPLRIAVKFDVPLVVWGENSAFEYGGEDDARRGFRLDAAWLAKHGVTHGTTARDWVSPELSEKELTPYFAPTDAELEQKGVLAAFLGYYLRWDPNMTAEVAKAHGFRTRPEGARTGIWDFADLDDDFISLHHWLKWYKFGFTRTFDNLSIEVRNGRMTREQAIAVLKSRGDETPHADIEKFCAWVGKTPAEFFAVAERFRNHDVWKRRADGVWHVPDFLIPDWEWR